MLFAPKILPRLTFLLFFASEIVRVVQAQCPKTNGTNKDDAYNWSEMSHDMFDSLVNGAVPIILLVAQSAGNDNIVVRVMDTLLLIVTPYVMPIVILWKFDECHIPIWVKVLRTIGSLLSIPRIFTIHKRVNWTDKIASIATIPMYIADIATWSITLLTAHEDLDGILFTSYFVFLGVALLISFSVLVIFIFTFDNTSTTEDDILSNSISMIFGIFTLINLMLNAISLSTLHLEYYFVKAILALTLISIGRYFDDKSYIYKALRQQINQNSTNQSDRTIKPTGNNSVQP